MENIEHLILRSLVYDEEFSRGVLPFLDEKFFDNSDRVLYRLVNKHVQKYNTLPTTESLAISLSNEDIPEVMWEGIEKFMGELNGFEPKDLPNREWLMDETEGFCKGKMLFDAISDGINVIQGEDENTGLGDIAARIEEANAFCFDNRVGHSYFDDAQEAWKRYTTIEERIAFDLDVFNRATMGGTPKKTLNVILADTNVGKSLCLCSFASSWIKQGKNVLYISMEMSEEMTRQRIDANLLDVDINKFIDELDEETFCSKVREIQQKGYGDFYVKQFPTGAAHVGHFRHLLRELKTKQNFVPDVICLDYLNICSSQRAVGNNVQSSYGYVKTIAEEVRGLAIEYDVPIWTATQSNRNGAGNVDLSLTDTSESYGVPQTADCMWGVIQTDDMAKLDQFLFVQLKSRYTKKQEMKHWLVGVDYSRMTLYEDVKSHSEILQEKLEGGPTPEVTPQVTPVVGQESDPFAVSGSKKKSSINFDNLNF